MASTTDNKRSIEVDMAERVGVGLKPIENPWALVRSYPKVICYAALANIGPLMFGYDLVIVGAISALPKFR